MPKRRAVLTVAILLGGCGGFDPSALSGSDGFDRRVYVGAGALLSRLEPDSDDAALSLDEDRGAGGSVALGYDIGNRLSVEAHVAALGEATFEPEGEVAYQVGGISGILYMLSGEHDRALREGVSLFGRLGLGAMGNQVDELELERENDAHLLAGAGVEYGFGNGLALRGELVSHDTDAGYGQLALLYRFGEAQRARAAVPSADEQTRELPSERARRDADEDGVADADDRCDDTPPGRPVDAGGCELLGGAVEGLAFEVGSDTLTSEARGVLDDIAATLRDYPLLTIAIEAHTDNRGSAVSNLDLSRRRALAVARYLADAGVEPLRLRPRAFGESRPRASNATAEGRAENRRVELLVIDG